MTQLTNIRGMVHGRTIELEQEVAVPDGNAVTITITSIESSPQGKAAQSKLEAAAGLLAGLDHEIDEFNQWYREARHTDPANGRVIE